MAKRTNNNKKGHNGKQPMKIKYLDGRMLTVKEIVELHPDLNAGLIRVRVSQYGKDNIEQLLKPRRNCRPNNADEIDAELFKGLGPRTEVETLTKPTDYEKELWGY